MKQQEGEIFIYIYIYIYIYMKYNTEDKTIIKKTIILPLYALSQIFNIISTFSLLCSVMEGKICVLL